jgi:hypothetical protein
LVSCGRESNEKEAKMDERFRRKGLWLGLGAVAIIFMCLMLCGLGTMAMFTTRSGPVYVPPAPGEEGAAPPQVYQGHAPRGMGHHGGGGILGFVFRGIGLVFMLVFSGLLLLLLFGLIKRVFWGHRHWGPPHRCGPKGKEWKGRPHAARGPWPWHYHGAPWEVEDEAAEEEDEADMPDPGFEEVE